MTAREARTAAFSRAAAIACLIAAYASPSVAHADPYTDILRAHHEQSSRHGCAEFEDGVGCNCLELSRLIASDLEAIGKHPRVVTLIRRNVRPFPDGVIPGHAVVYVDSKMLDPESHWVSPAGSYAPLWNEYVPITHEGE
jgi:hypothetical protein